MQRLVMLTILLLSAVALLTDVAAAQTGQNQFQIMDLGSAFSAGAQQQPGKQNQQIKQQKQKDCARQANDQNLRGDARQRFMQGCTGGN